MIDIFTTVLVDTTGVLYEGSLYILIGFAVAGSLHEFLPTRWLSRWIGDDSPRAIVTAAILGIPVPLCSCGVLPTATELRRKGAGRAPTMSFLVSTPETGVDSIALTYGFFGGVLAVYRPLVAVVTGTVAGFLSMLSISPRGTTATAHEHAHEHPTESPSRDVVSRVESGEETPSTTSRLGERLRSAARHGFVTMLDELSFWLAVGVLLTGLLSALIPKGFFSTALGLGSGLLPMLLMIAVGVPLYVCASASTPVAAALVAGGLSPGAALVFLLVGPATNAATIALVGRLLGGRQLRIYLGSIVGVSLTAGWALDLLAGDAVRAATMASGMSEDSAGLGLLKALAAVAFVVLLAQSAWRTRWREGRREARSQVGRLGDLIEEVSWRRLARPPIVVGSALLLAASWLSTGILVVEPGHRGVVQRFGRVVESDLPPGLHFHWPPPIARGAVVDVARVRGIEVDRTFRERPSYFLTADQNLLDVRGVVYYRIADAGRFVISLDDAEALISSVAQSAFVHTIASTPIDLLYTTARAETEGALTAAIAEGLVHHDVGIEPLRARLLDVHAPESIHADFRDVASALEDRERRIHEAHGYATERRLSAAAEAAEIVERARAARHRVQRIAAGETVSFGTLSEVYRRAPEATGLRLYLETVERALDRPHKYIDGVSGSGGEVDLWIGPGGVGRWPTIDSTSVDLP